jgi:hypothetical protein
MKFIIEFLCSFENTIDSLNDVDSFVIPTNNEYMSELSILFLRKECVN